MIKIKDPIEKGESETVEFKPSLSQTDKIMECVSAFSNTKGGIIVIGVTDKGEVGGVDIGKKTIETLANRIKQNTDPAIYPSISVENVEGKDIIVIEVKKSKTKPVFAFDKVYKRVGKSNQRVSSDEIRKLALEGKKIYWDEEICEGANLEDIDEDKVRWFLEEARHKRGLDINENSPVEEALLRLKLLKAGKPTNGAVLLFGKDPQRRFIQSEVKCIRFKGVSVTGEMIDLRTVDGDVFDQLIEAEKFIFNNIALSAWIEEGKIQRQERWEYPPKAIREALANAISHRDYETTSKVQVRIFDDRMEFWNAGRLPEGWTVETLRQVHESIPRNPAIAKQFFWVRYIEEVGTGTNKIIEWCIDWGLPEPEFEFTGTSLVVTFRKSRLTDEYLEQLGLNDRQKRAITYLKEHGKIDRKTYCDICGVGKTVAHEELADMVNKELIDMVGKGRGVHYILRMKRTISGRLGND
ncbi:MAG: putative DNA binding domain-containing protein [Candidatus Thermoplasmatota archaeon]|nr:putative DNA binding domain-containing protein [Candidatus Thermoplasmatota archaeon]